MTRNRILASIIVISAGAVAIGLLLMFGSGQAAKPADKDSPVAAPAADSAEPKPQTLTEWLQTNPPAEPQAQPPRPEPQTRQLPPRHGTAPPAAPAAEQPIICPDGTIIKRPSISIINCPIQCPDGSWSHSRIYCKTAQCPDGTWAGSQVECKVQCPDGTWESSKYFCKVECPDGTWASSQSLCKVRCPDGTYESIKELCDVQCADGTWAASLIQCPDWRLPGSQSPQSSQPQNTLTMADYANEIAEAQEQAFRCSQQVRSQLRAAGLQNSGLWETAQQECQRQHEQRLSSLRRKYSSILDD